MNQISKEKEVCFICGGDVQLIKNRIFTGVTDKHFYPCPLCERCGKIWDKYSDLLDDDKSNFRSYADIIRNFVLKHEVEK